jgi:hypothetical protein
MNQFAEVTMGLVVHHGIMDLAGPDITDPTDQGTMAQDPMGSLGDTRLLHLLHLLRHRNIPRMASPTKSIHSAMEEVNLELAIANH